MFAIPIFFGPIVIDLLMGYFRKTHTYRLSDLITNLSLSALSIMAGLAVSGATYALYHYINQHYAVMSLSPARIGTWVFAFLGYDFLYYCAHRAHHRVSILWASHVVHHSGEDCNFGLALRQSITGQLSFWIFFLPLAALGVGLQIYLIVILVQLVYQYLIHNEYVKDLGWLEWVLVTPSQHRVHHSRNHQYLDKNYGNILVLWDRLFGTYQRELPTVPVVYGLSKPVRTWDPLTINFHYYLQLKRKLQLCKSLGEKMRCLFAYPAWMPEHVDTTVFADEHDNVSSRNFTKYAPTVPASAMGYAVWQLFTMFLGFSMLLWQMGTLSLPLIVLYTLFVLSSAYATGGILDAKPIFWRWELIRQAVILVVAFTWFWWVHAPVQPLAGLPFGYALLSIGYLLWFRSDFLQSDRQKPGMCYEDARTCR